MNMNAEQIAEEHRLHTAAEIQRCKMEMHSKMEGIKSQGGIRESRVLVIFCHLVVPR